MKRREKLTSTIIFAIGLTGFVLFFFSKQPPLPPVAMLFLWSSIVCRMFKQGRLFGMFILLNALAITLEIPQKHVLLLAAGFFFNGLVVVINKGMPV